MPVAKSGRRPLSPLHPPRRETTSRLPKASLPAPPAAPAEEEYSWNVQWPELLGENMSFWSRQLYVRCPGCWKYFGAPSAFKQHLLHKKGTFRHVPDHIFQNWNFDSLWDPAWKEIEESKKAEEAEGPTRTIPNEPEGEPTARVEPVGEAGLNRANEPAGEAGLNRANAPSWHDSLPTPPPPIRDAASIRELESQGWFRPVPDFVVEMLSEQAHRAGCPTDVSRNNWYEYIKTVLDALETELADPKPSSKVLINFAQIPDATVCLRLNSQWTSEEILAHIGSKMGVSFETLGARWRLSTEQPMTRRRRHTTLTSLSVLRRKLDQPVGSTC